jgi:tetratricopeptide (TPR) repeat protein
MKNPIITIFILILMTPLLLLSQESEASFLTQGDNAYNSYNNEKALENYKKILVINPDNYEANWKASRACVDIGEMIDDDDIRAGYYSQSEKYARTAVKLDPDGSNGHLYLSVALGRVALDASPKQRIKMSKEVKEEADHAIRLDPNNDIAYHVLGRWHRKIANLSWIEKGFADMFLGGVPKEASNEEAVKNFKKAIELNPSSINHHLELAITFEKMDKEKLAIENFRKCLSIKSDKPKDKKYQAIAQEHLNDLL